MEKREDTLKIDIFFYGVETTTFFWCHSCIVQKNHNWKICPKRFCAVFQKM